MGIQKDDIRPIDANRVAHPDPIREPLKRIGTFGGNEFVFTEVTIAGRHETPGDPIARVEVLVEIEKMSEALRAAMLGAHDGATGKLCLYERSWDEATIQRVYVLENGHDEVLFAAKARGFRAAPGVLASARRRSSVVPLVVGPGITCTPGVRGNRPCVAGTRIEVNAIRIWREEGLSDDEILEQYPSLTREQLARVWCYLDAPNVPVSAGPRTPKEDLDRFHEDVARARWREEAEARDARLVVCRHCRALFERDVLSACPLRTNDPAGSVHEEVDADQCWVPASQTAMELVEQDELLTRLLANGATRDEIIVALAVRHREYLADEMKRRGREANPVAFLNGSDTAPDLRADTERRWRIARALRPEVLLFAAAMEERLRANDHKTGWRSDDYHALMDRLHEEAGELEGSILAKRAAGSKGAARIRVRKEAADVANFAMMLADNEGDLMGLAPNAELHGDNDEVLCANTEDGIALRSPTARNVWMALASTRGTMLAALAANPLDPRAAEAALKALCAAEDALTDRSDEAPFVLQPSVGARRAVHAILARADAERTEDLVREEDRRDRLARLKPNSIWLDPKEQRLLVVAAVRDREQDGNEVSWSWIGEEARETWPIERAVSTWRPMRGSFRQRSRISAFDAIELLKLALGGDIRIEQDFTTEHHPGAGRAVGRNEVRWPAWVREIRAALPGLLHLGVRGAKDSPS